MLDVLGQARLSSARLVIPASGSITAELVKLESSFFLLIVIPAKAGIQ